MIRTYRIVLSPSTQTFQLRRLLLTMHVYKIKLLSETSINAWAAQLHFADTQLIHKY